eukprot:m.577605 g.577605  ORF g.577605 m.577605 type:complete len:644 (+) comp22298_c0_seq2:317-2248(+)
MADQGDYSAVANVLRKDLKKMLREDNIRLWDPPYTNPKTKQGSFSKDFLEHYLQKLEKMHNTDDVDIPILEKLLERIRRSALDRREPKTIKSPSNSTALPVPRPARVERKTQPVPKKESKMMKAMSNIGKSFKKKKEQVSFENDAFFLAHQAQENEGANGDDDEGLYFDQLSAEEQEKYDKNMEALRALEAEEEAKKDAQKRSNTDAAVQASKDKQPASTDAPGSRLSTRRSSLATGYGSDEEIGSASTESDATGRGGGGAGVQAEVLRCWRREPGDDGCVLLIASSTGEEEGLHITKYASLLDEHQGGTTDHAHAAEERGRGGGGIMARMGSVGMSFKKSRKKTVQTQPPVSENATEVNASKMLMSTEQRVAIMTLVRDGGMSVDDAMAYVIKKEATLAKEGKTQLVEEKVAPLAALFESMDSLDEQVLPRAEKMNIMRDVRDGHLTIAAAVKTVKALKRRSNPPEERCRPPRPRKPSTDAPPPQRPAPPRQPPRPTRPLAGAPTKPPPVKPSAPGTSVAVPRVEVTDATAERDPAAHDAPADAESVAADDTNAGADDEGAPPDASVPVDAEGTTTETVADSGNAGADDGAEVRGDAATADTTDTSAVCATSEVWRSTCCVQRHSRCNTVALRLSSFEFTQE